MLNSLQISSGSLHPAGVRAVQNNATSIRVTWIPSSPPDSVWIVYNTGGVGMNVTVDDVNTSSLILTNLTNGNNYTISVVTTSLELYSSSIAVSLSKY